MEFITLPSVQKTCSTSVPQRLDSLKWSAWHTKLTLVLCLGWAFDAFEITIITAILPTLKSFFQISSTQASLFTTLWLMGALVGSVFFGYIADRYGRKFTFLITLLIYSLMSLVTACSPSYEFFLAFRFLCGVGVGGEYPAINVMISEMTPKRHRGKVNAMVMGSWSLGALLAYGLQIPILRYLSDFWAWRICFLIAGLFSFLVVIIRHTLVESPRWLLTQGKFEEADRITCRIEELSGQDNIQGTLVDQVSLMEYTTSSPNRSIFENLFELLTKFKFRLIFAAVVNASQAFSDYGVSNLLSIEILSKVAFSNSDVPLFFLYGVICTVPGYFLVISLIDRLGRKFLLLSQFTLCIIAVGCLIPVTKLALSDNGSSLIGVHCLYQFAYSSLMGTIYPTITEIFPTRVRATALGLAVGFGRIIAAIAPPILLAVAQQEQGLDNISMAFVAVIIVLALGLVAAIGWALKGVEAKNRSLEAIDGDSTRVDTDVIGLN